jgi:hypothetical protein
MRMKGIVLSAGLTYQYKSTPPKTNYFVSLYGD